MKVDTLQSGQRRYRVRVRLRGRMSSGTFTRKAEAIRFIEREERAAQLGTMSALEQSRERTAADLIDRYIDRILIRKKRTTQSGQYNQLQFWRRYLGSMSLVEVTPPVISDGKFLLEQIVGPSTVNRYLSALSHVFTIAIKEWRWCEHNPVRDVFRLKEPKGRTRCLDIPEQQRLLLFCRTVHCEYLYPIVVLALSTAPRKGEIKNLIWPDVNLNWHESVDEETGEIREYGLAILRDTKNGDDRGVVLFGEALRVMRDLHARRDPSVPFCFPSTEKDKPVDFRRSWESARERARITDFHFHDLRHSAASYLAMQGASASEIAEILGHKSLTMVKRYAHVMKRHVAGIVSRMNKQHIPLGRAA